MSAILGAVGAASKFNPLLVDWHVMYYPGGDAFQSQGYTNNQVLNVGEPIPDETVVSDDLVALAGATETTLTYVASSNVNGRPAIRGADTAGDQPDYTVTFTAPLLADATGYSVVAVWNQGAQTNHAFSALFHDSVNRSKFRVLVEDDGAMAIYFGGTAYYPTAGTISVGTTHAIRCFADNTASTAHVDATQVVTAGAGDTLTGLDAFNQQATSWPFSGDLAFVGVYEGDVTGDANWAMFKNWADAEFDCTI